mmetsp:Transcript_31558/g.93938  ORF Transcript_31558/g.93938 Transcript_31558/m.93938 type:complete len:259 (-) Transcript_31558:318-1094(-)
MPLHFLCQLPGLGRAQAVRRTKWSHVPPDQRCGGSGGAGFKWFCRPAPRLRGAGGSGAAAAAAVAAAACATAAAPTAAVAAAAAVSAPAKGGEDQGRRRSQSGPPVPVLEAPLRLLRRAGLRPGAKLRGEEERREARRGLRQRPPAARETVDRGVRSCRGAANVDDDVAWRRARRLRGAGDEELRGQEPSEVQWFIALEEQDAGGVLAGEQRRHLNRAIANPWQGGGMCHELAPQGWQLTPLPPPRASDSRPLPRSTA